MNPAQIIARKRDGHELSDNEIAAFIGGYARSDVPDYQMSALAMAIYLGGMTPHETAVLTQQMLDSGSTFEWASATLKVDKHSTGGIGDKVSIILTPLLACCGLQVPMISGRGLGATGGTLDKLESIPGFRTDLSMDEIRDITGRVGCVITGATADIAPADKKLYALRDVTATVASIPLITASIMSKKLAENLDALVLDVKCGSGAFMKSLEDARKLAKSLVETGRRMGVKTSAIITDMNQPLGRMVGNTVEITESIDALSGHGPSDLMEVTLELAAELLVLTELNKSLEAAKQQLNNHLQSGKALEKFHEMVQAQAGNLDQQKKAAPVHEIVSDRVGTVSAIDTEKLGMAIIELGGGRRALTDQIDHSVGLEMLVYLGEKVDRGQPLVRMLARPDDVVTVSRMIFEALTIDDSVAVVNAVIVEKVS